MASYLKVCPNAVCRLGFPWPPMETDKFLYPGIEKYCPRCGTPWDARPAWKGPAREDFEGE